MRSMDRTPATRKQVMDFRKRVFEDFGYMVKIKTVNFFTLARCAATFATVIGYTHGINLNDILAARILAREHNIILDFPVVCTDNMESYKMTVKEV